MSAPKTLLEAVKHFANPDNCREFLVARRWPNGITCPTCGSDKVYFDSSRNGWECKTRHPKRKFTLKTGTIFEDSPIGLDKWLPVVWMAANMKNGVSSWEIHRSVGVTQKTAWFMLQRIRLALQDSNGGGGKLGGEVEVDETYIGGKARNMSPARRRAKGITQSRSYTGKIAVMGLLERNTERGKSRVRTAVIDGRKKHQMQPTVRQHVEAGASLNTDAHFSYQGLNSDYMHNVIDHAEAYVDGTVHTNGLENYWSLLKRSIRGTYVSVEPFHLFRYLDEQAFRFNERTNNDAGRFDLAIKGIVGKRITYTELIGGADRI
jgi:transposase-like protein